MLVVLALVGNSCQNGIHSPNASLPQDRFLGTWRLDTGKRPRWRRTPYGIEEVIYVGRQGHRFIVTTQSSDAKGNHFSWFKTEMKGEQVEVQTSEKQALQGWHRVTRKDTNSFLEDFEIGHNEYTVSADGLSMTLRRKWDVDYDPEREFFFNRIR